MNEIEIKISRPQANFIFSPHKFPAIIGGLGSGKSEAIIKRFIHLASQEKGLIFSHSFPTRKLAKRRGLYGYMDNLNKLNIKPTINLSDLTIDIKEFNARIYLDTYHEPEAIVGFEVHHGGIDELDMLKKEKAELVYRKITERVRKPCHHPCGNTLAIATTPNQGEMGFCFERYGRGEYLTDGFHYIKAGTASNKFLPDGYIEQIVKNYDPIMANAFIHGEWVNFTKNRVYYVFDKTTHHSDRILKDTDKTIYIGQDFNVGGCVSIAFIIENKIASAVDEFITHDTKALVIEARRRYGKRHIIVHPDASGKNRQTNASETDIQILQNANFEVRAEECNPPIRDRINCTNGAFSHHRLFINTYTCPELTKALEAQGYDKKGEPEKWDKHPSFDDRVDAMGYFVVKQFPINNLSAFTYKPFSKTSAVRDYY